MHGLVHWVKPQGVDSPYDKLLLLPIWSFAVWDHVVHYLTPLCIIPAPTGQDMMGSVGSPTLLSLAFFFFHPLNCIFVRYPLWDMVVLSICILIVCQILINIYVFYSAVSIHLAVHVFFHVDVFCKSHLLAVSRNLF